MIDRTPLFWIILTVICLAVQGYYTMVEMAIVSFNRVRLQYYVNKGMRRAKWISYLLQKPSRLFGTTLLGINVAMQVGSQCSREVYQALHLDPDFAPITQILLVLILAELSPLFAARRYAEHVAMLGVPVVYASSRILAPVIWVIGGISKAANWLVRGPTGATLNRLSREELQHLVEGREPTTGEEAASLNRVVRNIFAFRKKTAAEVMNPLKTAQMARSDASVGELKRLVRREDLVFVPIYYRQKENIVGIAFVRDLIPFDDGQKVRQHARPPWFVTEETTCMQILKQFRHNGQTVAVVLDRDGKAVGLLGLEDILDELFGEIPPLDEKEKGAGWRRKRRLIERTFPSSTPLQDLTSLIDVEEELKGQDLTDTLADWMTDRLGHQPELGEAVRIGHVYLSVSEAGLLGPKTITIRTER